MIYAMRELALLELNRRLKTDGENLATLRQTHGLGLAPLLVEASENLAKVYLLQADPNQRGHVRLWVEQLDDAKRLRLPFNRPSGSQSAAIGPVLKRTSKPKDTPPYGPSQKIQNTTRLAFEQLAHSNTAWAAYFREVCTVLFSATQLHYGGQVIEVGDGHDDPHALAAAVRLIPDKETVFLAVVDAQDRWPGERSDYQLYLAAELAKIKYITSQANSHSPADCPLCGTKATTLYPNALKGAGLNLSNMDRIGAFANLDISAAWKAYGLCLDCADLLYLFKNHLLPQFIARIAGDKALLLPALLGRPAAQRQFIEDWHEYLRHLDSGAISSFEQDLMEFFAEQDDGHVVIHIIWAQFGQLVDEVRGQIDEVLPSRLRTLMSYNGQANDWTHPLHPTCELESTRLDLSLSALASLMRRPGGRKAERLNASPRLFELKRQVAAALYHGRPLGHIEASLWTELLTTARGYLDEALISGQHWGLLHQPTSNTKTPYLTLAAWVRHLARFLHYLNITGVLPMTDKPGIFEPHMPSLQPYFQPGSGINTHEKAFAFLLGILYGKLLEVQAARGVNVASNALTWLKRLRLSGHDLPTLYIKIREKLITYGTEGNRDVRALVQELGRLGTLLGNQIHLDNQATSYFLLLGQSVTIDVLPTKERQASKGSNHD